MNNNIARIQGKVLPVLKNAGVIRSGVFGSYVREAEKEESDIDILIDFPRGKGLFELAGLQLELEQILDRKVDLVEYDGLNPLIKARILAEEVQIL